MDSKDELILEKKLILKIARVIILMIYQDLEILVTIMFYQTKNHMKMFWLKFMGSKPLGIWFEKIDGFIKIYNGIRYLVLFGPESQDAIYNRFRYLIS